jgi:4-hydroxy-2-oxoglutarate aldolase
MASPIEKLRGVFLPVTTPFNEDMSVNYDGLARNMETYAGSGIHGYLALGSNGENRSLTEEEKRTILKIICDTRSPGQTVMAGCIYETTLHTIDFMHYAKDIGANFATLLSPSYFRKHMTHDILVEYFTECADSVDIPVLLYNAPGFTGVTLHEETVEILSKHPNILGMKDSAPSGIENFCRFMSPEFAVLAGSASFLYPAMCQGVPGGIISIANAFPAAALTLFSYGQQGHSEEGERFHEIMKEVNRGVSGVYGVAGVKAAMDIAGLVGGPPRKPLRSLSEEERDQIKQILTQGGIL